MNPEHVKKKKEENKTHNHKQTIILMWQIALAYFA